jgi:hypothetical protein
MKPLPSNEMSIRESELNLRKIPEERRPGRGSLLYQKAIFNQAFARFMH